MSVLQKSGFNLSHSLWHASLLHFSEKELTVFCGVRHNRSTFLPLLLSRGSGVHISWIFKDPSLLRNYRTHSSVLIVILGSCLMFTYYPEPLVLDVILGYAYAVLQEMVAFWRCDWFKDLVSQAKTLTFFPLHSWAEIIMHHKLTDCLSLLSNLSQFFFISFSYCGWKSVYNSLLEKIQTKQVSGC